MLTELLWPGHRRPFAEDIRSELDVRGLEVRAEERVLDYLREISIPGRPGVLPHPLDMTVARVP